MSRETAEHNKAAAVFTAILTVVAGGAGLAVAGLILGADYLIHGSPDEREQVAARRAKARRDWYADAVAWLEADRADRARHRKLVRDWFEADPANRGDKPSASEGVGRVAARCWYGAGVGLARFGRGWRDGRNQARQRRSDGDSRWWKPQRPGSATPDPADIVDAGPGADTTRPEPPQPPPQPRPEPSAPHHPDDDNIIDGEVIDESPTPQPGQDLAVADQQPQADDRHGPRIVHLGAEVADSRRNRHDDPSPPRSALAKENPHV